ncbi:helix-turn-helix domain-containing protein [Candidatus Frankia nodulisporulans]|uniref:winged helix-turn-helix transcriptional regulator n=1 Tax=Candidatus Frankia nodulisporulans TaxID=2060052 RepID=UPI0030B85ABB
MALAALVELLGRRYALGVYWRLRAGAESFRTLEARLDAPAAQLTQRLRELREGGIVEVDEVGEYRLTAHGRRLQGVIEPLAAWADEWAALRPRQRVPRGAADRGYDGALTPPDGPRAAAGLQREASVVNPGCPSGNHL